MKSLALELYLGDIFLVLLFSIGYLPYIKIRCLAAHTQSIEVCPSKKIECRKNTGITKSNYCNSFTVA